MTMATEDYERDGAVCLRGVLSPAEVARNNLLLRRKVRILSFSQLV